MNEEIEVTVWLDDDEEKAAFLEEVILTKSEVQPLLFDALFEQLLITDGMVMAQVLISIAREIEEGALNRD